MFEVRAVEGWWDTSPLVHRYESILEAMKLVAFYREIGWSAHVYFIEIINEEEPNAAH